MSICVMSYALPSDREVLKKYAEKTKGWVDVILSEPNNTELRLYRSSNGKEVLAITEIQSVAEAEKFLASDKFKTLLSELEKAGCGNFQIRTWPASPLIPNAVRRTS